MNAHLSGSKFGFDPCRNGHRRQCAGPGWRPVRAQRAEGPLSPDSAGVGGWSIRRSTCGMGAEDGQVCARYRLQTKGTDRLFRSAMALDRGAHLRLAGQLPSPGSGLRDQSSHERGLDQNRHDPPHATKTRLSILRQVLRFAHQPHLTFITVAQVIKDMAKLDIVLMSEIHLLSRDAPFLKKQNEFL